jgi:hypothetical protein
MKWVHKADVPVAPGILVPFLGFCRKDLGRQGSKQACWPDDWGGGVG